MLAGIMYLVLAPPFLPSSQENMLPFAAVALSSRTAPQIICHLHAHIYCSSLESSLAK